MYSKAAHAPRFSFSPLSLAAGLVAVLVTAYIGLIAVIMSYAALTVEFSESLRREEAAVAALEGSYLDAVSRITTADYHALGYAMPAQQSFVPEVSGTALR